MSQIEGSVGQNGDNLARDVRVVQQLLNRQDLAPLARIGEDGRVGSATIEAIRHFQTRYLGMTSPDGRVDPEGRTIRKLSSGSTERGTGESPETRTADRDARAERVDPRVKETAVTTRIIDNLVPRMGNLRAKIIAGYLSDSDQFWKVNYHWEYLLQMVEHSLTLPLEDDDKRDLQNIRSNLMGCKPNPASGYASSPVGKPEDRTSADDAIKRYNVLVSSKQVFGKVTNRANLKEKSRKSPSMFDLAAAPVARPGTSKHGSGYALDIGGDNSSIKSLCSGLGATLVFDEKSHVHVEFKNGLSR
ncbi:MAG: peptidoglycan-binding domain-containing protein [Candidatus Limnocylindrales bacterium]